MKNSFFEPNMDLLKKNHPDLWNMIRETAPQPAGEIVAAENGKPNLAVETEAGQELLLHHEDDPEKEAAEFLNIVPQNSRGTVIFQGMGLGYGPLSILENREDIRFLIVFELYPEIFVQALHALDLSALLSDQRVILSVGQNPDVPATLAMAARAMRLEDVSMLKHVPSFQYDKDGYENLATAVYHASNEFNISANTFKAYGETFISNRLSFLTMINHNSLIDSLAGRFEGIPAILVAAGPSLEKNIHLLPRFKDRAVIIAVDSALPALMKIGVEPDFVTSIDYKALTFEKIAKCAPESRDLSLICSSWVCKKIPKYFPAANIFWTYTSGAMEKWINRHLGGEIVIPGAGTVAHLNLIAAIIMKCSPIVFIGQDLSFSKSSEDSDHVSGVTFSKKNPTKAMLEDKNMLWVKANDGGKLPTIRQFYNYLHHFENMIRSNPGMYINATEGGAYIEGTEVMKLQHVLESYCSENLEVTGLIETINKKERLSEISGFLSEIRSMLKRISRVKKTIAKGDKASDVIKTKLSKLKKTKRKYKRFNDLPDSMKKKIMEVDKAHDKTDKEHSLWELFDEATMNALQLTDRMRHEIDRIEGDPDQYLEWLEKNMERLDEVSRVRKNILGPFEEALSGIVDHHDKERELFGHLDHSESSEQSSQIRMELARLYMDSEDLVLARPYLEKILDQEPENAQANYFMGKIAAHQTEYDRADVFFSKAEHCNPDEFSEKISMFREHLANEYLSYTTSGAVNKTNNYMIFKGLRYCPDHKKLLKELEVLLKNDMKQIEAAIEKEELTSVEKIIREREESLDAQTDLRTRLNKKVMGNYYKTCGKYYAGAENNLKAFELFHKAMTFVDNDPETRLLLADLLFRMGENEQGLIHFNTAVEINSEFVTEYERQKSQAAEKHAADSPESDQGQNDLQDIFLKGNSLFSQGRYEEAVECYRKVLQKDETNATVIQNMGAALKEAGLPEKAIECYEKTIALDPNAYNAYYNLGVAYQDMGEKDKAVGYFKNAVTLKPDFSGALLNLGNAYKSLGDLAQAEKYYKQVLQVAPDYIDAVNNLGVVYQEKGSAEEALTCFKDFLEKRPDNPHALANILDELQYACAWEDLDQYRQQALSLSEKRLLKGQKPVVKPFQSLRIYADPEFQLKTAKAWAPETSPVQFSRRSDHDLQRRMNKTKIRIGYVSGDFTDHPVGHILSNLLPHHNRDAFQIHCYSTTPDSDSVYRRIIEDHSDRFHDIRGMGHHEAASEMFEHEIDILVDLTGYTKGSNLQIFSMRPAPVQVSYLGFLGTTGAPYMDYIITDQVVTPENHAPYYTEKFAFLPDCYQVMDYSHISDGRSFSREEFNLPAEGTVFCSFNQPYKFDKDVFSLWMRILKRVEGSVLWLRQVNTLARANLEKYAEENGVSSDRLIFSEKINLADHLKRLELADIALDPVIYNGGATTNNALRAGLPVITLQGDSFVSRMSASSLTAMGLTELITSSFEEYEDLAVSLARYKSELDEIKAKINKNRYIKPLFDVKRFVDNLEGLYRIMHEMLLNGNNPVQIKNTDKQEFKR